MNYETLAEEGTIESVKKGLLERNFEPIEVRNKEEAMDKIKELIPKGASVMNGASRTLEEIGFIEYLKSGEHGWENLHEKVLAEPDKEKQALLRREAVVSDYYLGSVHALTQGGELIISSNSGSQLPHLAFTSPHVILVVGTQKIVSDLGAAFKRLEEYVVALEDQRLRQAYGIGTMRSKTLVLHHENPMMGRKVRIILVNEKLGF